jgi:plastocyanin
MSQLARVTLLAAGVAMFGPTGSAAGPTPAGSTHTVTIENMQFSPAELTVHPGDRIVWENKDLFPHTATASDKTFDSGSIASNGSWALETTKSADYPYGCAYHPTMKGKISVR